MQNPNQSTYLPYVESHKEARTSTFQKVPHLYGGRKTTCPLNIVVVGCGLGGLAAGHTLTEAGHNVTILESAPAIGEVGAGIQVSPNVSRLLIRWGLGEHITRLGVIPEAITFRNWKTGEVVGRTKWGMGMQAKHGAPYYHIHRADFHQLLFNLAVPNLTLRLNATVKSINPDVPSCTLTTGEVVKCDLIIGADGVKSAIREVVVGHDDKPVATGDAAYRAIVPIHHLLADPELKPLVDTPEMSAWMGPGRHFMGYCIRAKKEYNIVLLHPDDGSVESWQAEGSADKMRATYAGWEPRVEKLLALVPSTLRWKLMDRAPLQTWIHSSNKVVLLGDSCHPMLPYRAQGAAMAVEDAAVIGNLFSHLTSKAQIPAILKAYESLRLPRASNTQSSSRLNQHIFHLDDGPDQLARDEAMRKAMNGAVSTDGNPNQWADEKKNIIQFSYDADGEVDTFWERYGKGIERLGSEEGQEVRAKL